MNKKSIGLLLAAILVLTSACLAFAEGPNGNNRKGKYTYRNIYKSCAQRGAVESDKPFISPADKTMAQWQRIFEKKDFEIFKCSEEFSKLSDADLMDVYSYLYSFAADSPSPAKCK